MADEIFHTKMWSLSSYPWCCVNPLNKATNLFPSDCCSTSFLYISSPQSTTVLSSHSLTITDMLFMVIRVCSEHIQYIQGFIYVNTDTYLHLSKFVVECIFINFHIRCRVGVWRSPWVSKAQRKCNTVLTVSHVTF